MSTFYHEYLKLIPPFIFASIYLNSLPPNLIGASINPLALICSTISRSTDNLGARTNSGTRLTNLVVIFISGLIPLYSYFAPACNLI